MRKALTIAALAVVPLTLPGCIAYRAVSADAPRTDSARLGQTIDVGGPRVTPLAVLEDSRCPSNARCIWAGQVRLSVRVTTGTGTRTEEISTLKPLRVADGTLALTDVVPTRGTTAPIAPEAYRFEFRFDGGL